MATALAPLVARADRRSGAHIARARVYARGAHPSSSHLSATKLCRQATLVETHTVPKGSVTEYSSSQPIRKEWTERMECMPRPLTLNTAGHAALALPSVPNA